MRKTIRFLTLLALLIAAATGARAQNATASHIIKAYTTNKTATMNEVLPYKASIIEVVSAVTGISGNVLTISGTVTNVNSSNTDVVTFGALEGWNTKFKVIAAGEAKISVTISNNANPLEFFISVIPPFNISLTSGTEDADKWKVKVGTANATALPIGGLKKNDAVTLTYGGRLKVKNVTATTDAEPDAWDGDLSKLTAESTAEFATATDGMTITGTLAANVKVSIAAGATVTLDGVTINGANNEDYKWAGLNCLGDATIILKDRTENMVQGFHEDYPGIHVPASSRLTITGGTLGNGILIATSNGYGAGIGGGNIIHCGNIYIQGGYIAATGGIYGAGIGGGLDAICGNITISGGTVRAMGGPEAAGIGGGSNGRCGGITITNGVTRVSAMKDDHSPYSIGAGNGGSCGTVAIGGTVYWQDNAAVNDGDTYLATNPLEYRPMPQP